MSDTASSETARKGSTTPQQSAKSTRGACRPAVIARGHKILANIQATLSEVQKGRMGDIKSQTSSFHERMLSGVTMFGDLCNADGLIAKFDALSMDRNVSEMQLRELISQYIFKLNSRDCSKLSSHVIDLGLKGSLSLAIDIAMCAVEFEEFKSELAQRVAFLMSSYVLYPGVANPAIIEFVASLLCANWPRAHARSNLESNEILYHIISSVKGWLMVIRSESSEDDETKSRCAVALYELCRFTHRRFWMKWPEIVDECYVAVEDALVSNIALSKEARRALVHALLQMQEWTIRNAKTHSNHSTQTY